MSDHEAQTNALEWFRYAVQDFVAAESALREGSFAPRHVCFLAQQAAEKAIKALLIQYRVEYPYTHDLDYLIGLLPLTATLGGSDIGLSRLTEWAIESRYPGAWSEANQHDAASALEQAQKVIELTRQDFGPTAADL